MGKRGRHLPWQPAKTGSHKPRERRALGSERSDLERRGQQPQPSGHPDPQAGQNERECVGPWEGTEDTPDTRRKERAGVKERQTDIKEADPKPCPNSLILAAIMVIQDTLTCIILVVS